MGLVCMLLVVFYTSTQDRIEYRDGHPYDSETYWHQARLENQNQPLRNWKPFVYRMLAPYVVGKAYPPLARTVDHWTAPRGDQANSMPPLLDPEDLLTGFTLLGFASGCLHLVLLFLFLRQYRLSSPIVLGLLLLYIASPLGPFRFSPYFPAFADPLAFVFFFALLWLYKRDPNLRPGTTAALCLLGFFGSFAREIVLLVPLTFLGAHGVRVLRGEARLFGSTSWMHLLPLASIALGLYMTRHLVVEAMGTYSTWGHAQQIWQRNAQFPEVFLVCWFLVLGPFVVWLALGLRERAARGFLARNPELPLYILGMSALAISAGNHTDRFMFWILPGLLPWLGFYLQARVAWPRARWAQVGFFGVLCVVQIVTYRAWLPIPNGNFDSLNYPGTPKHLWLAPFGEPSSFGQTQVAFMEHWSRVRLLLQYAFVASLLAGIWALDRLLARRHEAQAG